MESIGSRSQIDGRADGGYGAERLPDSPLSRQLEHQVAAHGVADQGDSFEAEFLRVMLDYRTHICREAGMVERRSELIGVAAVAHVHAHDVASRIPGPHGEALDIPGFRGPFKAVHQDQGQPAAHAGARLPVTMADHPAAVGGVDFNGFRKNGSRKAGRGR